MHEVGGVYDGSRGRFQRLGRKRGGIPPGPLPVLGKILVCLDWVLPRQEGAFADCRTGELALDYDSTPVCVYRRRRQVTKGTTKRLATAENGCIQKASESHKAITLS